jgi:hypothetical protein
MSEFSTFPKDKTSALTMLYLEKQDLSYLSPAELAEKYDEIYKEISNYYESMRYKY